MTNKKTKTDVHIEIQDLDFSQIQELTELDHKQLNDIVGGFVWDWGLPWSGDCPGGVLNGKLYGTC